MPKYSPALSKTLADPHLLILRAARHTSLEHYLFRSRGDYLLALGVGSLFNHSSKPNLDFRPQREQLLINYIAARDIKVRPI